MTGKAWRPCLICSRHLKTHRKTRICSKECRGELRRAGQNRAYLKRTGRTARDQLIGGGVARGYIN